ncbi:MAG: mycofactocin-coupled SDR family oxidoreductase [Thermoleophilia bacterium]|nr:mycofactocin-coupled SDR family oxidoreductase [Thermoleophilia bacterium]
MGRLSGKVAFVTGAARGQGRSHAVTLAREGAQIVAVDICEQISAVPYPMSTPEDLEETVSLVEALDQRCLAVQADTRDAKAMQEAADNAVAELGKIDIAAINHGIAVPGGWDETTEEVWNANIDTNLTGAWWATRAVIPHMIDNGGGSIVITSSVSGIRAFWGLTSYVASKHGLIGLMKGLAAELAPHWIRVNVICPTNVATPMLHNPVIFGMFAGQEEGTIDDMDLPARSMNLLPEPWIEPEAISYGVLYLASDEAKHVTGVTLPVDAGMSQMPPGIPPAAQERLAELEAQG